MKDFEFIAHQLEQSKQWKPLNADTLKFHRKEGTLDEFDFNQQILAHLTPFQDTFNAIQQRYACGFEIEFYLNPDKVPQLETALARILPASQMLLIDLTKPIASNGRHFYLMAENTGQAPEGMQSYELVSPILDPKSLPYYLDAFLGCLAQFDARDNQHLGFHLHISTHDDAPISPLALLYFLDQANCFNWPERQFTRDLVSQFFDYQPNDWQLIFEEITRKCYNLNLLHFAQNNRIELRSIGGSGYLAKPNILIETCLKALQAFELAQLTPNTEVAQQILERYTLNKKIQPLSSVDSNHLIESCEISRQNQLWFSTVRDT